MKTLLLFALLCGAVSAEIQPTIAQESALTAGSFTAGTGLSIGATAIPPDNEIPQYTFTSPVYAKHISIAGHLLITKQEAQDVVRAIEILDDRAKHWGRHRPDADDPKYEGECGPRQFLLDYAAMFDKDKADMKWARSILEAWKKRVEAGK